MTTSDLPGVMTMRERMLAGQPYITDSEIAALTAAAQQRMAAYNASDPGDPQTRRRLLEELLGEVGEDVEVRTPVYLDYGDRITIGPRTFVNFGLTALDVAPITIGADVQIGPHVQLLTPTHPLDAQQRKDKWEGAAPITIGDNVWLGGGVIVCPGVTIGENTVVGAGAVVVSDLPAGVLAVGQPAKVIRQLG
ncbi:sugar O-acetyltransferase [Nocardioides campestrisoli]|uniref:sugar O-acetyltransferase n=1 Tax=Nocardioides campestrisoli TaxID=2736757 RepID=UPI00163DA5F0|nr:sugar O-acetyltransferase [Nocardioides campestrisoli]